ncbi:MAG: tetratricopeptide repeat protein [Gemmatimonadaceae bacterium]
MLRRIIVAPCRRAALARRGALLLSLTAAPLLATHAQGGRKPEPEPKRPRFTIPRDSNSAGAYYYHGLQVLSSKPTEAADAFWWAARLDPQWAEPLYARRVALHMADTRRYADYLRGRGYAKEVQRIDSLQHRAFLLNPFVYRRLDKDLLERTIDDFVARTRRESGDDPGGMPVRLRSRDAAFDDPRFAAWLAYGEGKFPDALRYLSAALKRSPKAYSIHSDRADVFYLLGQTDSAVAELGVFMAEMRKVDEKNLLPFYDSKAFVEYEVGRVHVSAGDLGAAREAFGRALAEDLSFYMAHAALAEVALAQRDTATALAEYDLAVQLSGDEPGLRYNYGVTLFSTAHYDSAATQFARAVELDPYYAAPYYPLAYIYDGQGKDAQAIATYERYLHYAPAADGQRLADARTRLTELRGGAAPPSGPATPAASSPPTRDDR